MCKGLYACMLLSVLCVLWDNADAKVALGWRTHQLRNKTSPFGSLFSFEDKMCFSRCNGPFQNKRSFYFVCRLDLLSPKHIPLLTI